jgi:16S rRNA (guanine(966)-N(2))-methyltransferase RsmD
MTPRVIAGSAKGRKLKVAESGTRPLTDRIKTSIFDLIAEFLPEAKVLDLFAGSGAFGIEALSRGATRCLFIDNGDEQVALLKANLEQTRLTHKAEIRQQSVSKELLTNLNTQFSLVFLDPPFPMEQADKQNVLSALDQIMSADSLAIFRYENDESYPARIGRLTEVYQKQYGQSIVSFYKKENEL